MSASGSTLQKKEKKGARFPPKRGQVKEKIFERLCKTVISVFSKAKESSKRDLLRTIPQVQLKHVMRESNMAADANAKKEALAPHGFYILFDCPCEFVLYG
ncbi:hypothetical protein SLEP1_g59171 [Rubroshorea leprosula]|uniref:Uncharacterized protein n=1 Tax=Rubroshorea leprosula TaxID=152421 RepID=A0AAV5MRZ7_9ROSI|nr:hypothetical protein SLEP1_g59171 [Rubroshorea leprosula]